MNNLLEVLGIYAIWGDDGLATSLRSTALNFAKVGVEFMICVWLWTFSPLPMTFFIPAVYIAWLWGWKAYREANFERREAVRRAKAFADIDAIFHGNN